MTDDSQKPPIVPVNGKEADLRKALPLTLGDAESLKKQGVSLLISGDNPEIAYPLARYILKKANADITDDEIGLLPLRWITRIIEIFGELQGGQDIPF